MKTILVILALIACSCAKSTDRVQTEAGFSTVSTVEHDGCLFVIAQRYQAGVSILHHPKCTNHETSFR